MQLTFGAWLKKHRRALDLTQNDLAARAYCSVNTIRKIEADDLMPSKALALELARALGVPEAVQPEFVRFARTPEATVPADAFQTASSPPLAPAPSGERTDLSAAHDAPPALKFAPPAPLTAVLGREHDTGVIVRALRLPATRLVTITGPPGAGKTRLSLEVANELQDEFEHGAAFVELAPVSDVARVESAIAQALNVRESSAAALPTALRAMLRDKQLLLVLDNLEHLLGAAPLASELLRLAPRLKILTTSREPLRLYGEREIALAPLALPPLEPLPPLDELENFPAVQLFLERAQAVKPDFALTRENAAPLARIVNGLDGLPLAIEMAAPRVKFESPQQLLANLSNRLEMFASRPRDLQARQRTLRGALDWSYDLMEQAERRVFRRLGVFRGGFTLPAGNAVCGASTAEALQTLVEKSLLKLEHAEEGAPRYELLEMIREYALEQLTRANELDDARARHAAFYRALARAIAQARELGGVHGWRRFEARDLENFRLAAEWHAEHDPGGAIELVSNLTDFWVERGLMREGRERLVPLVSRAEDSPAYETGLLALAELAKQQGDYDTAVQYAEQVRARAASEELAKPRAASLLLLGYIALMRGEFARAETLLLDAHAQFEALGLPSYQARALKNLGLIAKDRGDLERAEEFHRAALDLRRELGLQMEIAQSLFNLAIIAFWRGDYARAIRVGTEAHALYVAEAGVNAGAYVNETVGMAYFKLGEYERAVETLQSSLRALRMAEDKRGLALVLQALGQVALAQEEWQHAQQHLREALTYALQTGEKRRAVFCLEGFADALAHSGNPARAAQLFGAADALRREIGIPVYPAERAAYDRMLKYTRASLSPAQFNKAWHAGEKMSMPAAIELAF